jgi:hypothetical protein
MGIDQSLIPSDIQDESQNTLEKAKFFTNGDGLVRVRTSAQGTFSPSGLSTAFKITTVDVSTSAVALPTTPLTDRNAISILNTSGSTTLYIGPDTGVTADTVAGTTSGWEIGPNEIWHVDVTDDITIYAIVASGTIQVKILEVA